MPSGLWLPRRYCKPTSVVFYHNPKTNHIINGFPDIYPLPDYYAVRGYQKVVCRDAHTMEIWSEKLRDQERREKEIEDAKREAIEGPVRDALRQQMVHTRDHTTDPKNREFLRRAVENAEEYDRQREKETRTSFQHMEGFEEGH
jgi:hypothetical protein